MERYYEYKPAQAAAAVFPINRYNLITNGAQIFESKRDRSRMKIKSILLLLICALHCIGISAWDTVHESPSEAERLKVIPLKDNHFSCSFDGVKHDFILDLPEKTEGAPLVLLLPGY